MSELAVVPVTEEENESGALPGEKVEEVVVSGDEYVPPAGAVTVAAVPLEVDSDHFTRDPSEPVLKQEQLTKKQLNQELQRPVPLQIVLCFSIAIFIVPLVTVLLAYYMDVQLLSYMTDSIDEYTDSRSSLRKEIASSQFRRNRVYLASLMIDDGSDLILFDRQSDFQEFVINNASERCVCEFLDSDTQDGPNSTIEKIYAVCNDAMTEDIDGSWAVNLSDVDSAYTTHNLHETCHVLSDLQSERDSGSLTDSEYTNLTSNLTIFRCTCGLNESPFNESSPQYRFVHSYDPFVRGNDRKKFCDLRDMTRMLYGSKHSSALETLTDCYNAVWAFLVIGGIFACLQGWGHIEVRSKDIKIAKRRYDASGCKDEEKKVTDEELAQFGTLFSHYYLKIDDWYRHKPRDGMGRDDFTLFVCSCLLYHVLCNLTQTMVVIIFVLTKQGTYLGDEGQADSDGTGTDCVVRWADDLGSFGRDLIPPSVTSAYAYIDEYDEQSGAAILEALLNDSSTVRWFFIFTLLATTVDGLYLIRVFDFDTQKILEYEWYQNVGYLLLSVILAFLFCMLIYSPLWGVFQLVIADGSLLPDWVWFAFVVSLAFYIALCMLPLFFCCCCSQGHACVLDCDGGCCQCDCYCCDSCCC